MSCPWCRPDRSSYTRHYCRPPRLVASRSAQSWNLSGTCCALAKGTTTKRVSWMMQRLQTRLLLGGYWPEQQGARLSHGRLHLPLPAS